jgi:hypothetical protein
MVRIAIFLNFNSGNISTSNHWLCFPDIRKTNIPDIRMMFRQTTMQEEWDFILYNSAPDAQSTTFDRMDTPESLSKLQRW